MEITIGSMRTEEELVKNTYSAVSEQSKEASGERTELQNRKAQQETSYDRVSTDGDTLSISEAGKAVSLGQDNKSVRIETEDGAVIQKEAEEDGQDSNVPVVNLSTYTETELKQMYLDGDITRTEYDEEISSRG